MRFLALLFFVCFSAAAQRPVELVFDSITTDDSDASRRKYTLSYHITNLTDKPVSFFLNTNSIVPVVSSSMSYSPHYKLYKDGKSVDVSGVFTIGEVMWESEAHYIRYVDSVAKAKPDPETIKKSISDHILQSLTQLKPGEAKPCSILLAWDFERYQKQDENEYFLDPDSVYSIELSMHLLLAEFEGRLEEAAYRKMLSDKTMITGWFTSNALAIDLSEKKIPANRD